MLTKNEIQLKLLLLGEQAVGKSSLINQYVDGKFDINLLCAAGLDLKKKYIKIDTTPIKLMIFDSAGHERYRGLSKNQLYNTKGVLIVYDVTDKESFNAISFWMKSVGEYLRPESSCIIIGNKIDLYKERKVFTEEGKKLADQYGVHFIETSAKSSQNVETAFTWIVKDIYDKEIKKRGDTKEEVNNILIKDPVNKKAKNKKCCL